MSDLDKVPVNPDETEQSNPTGRPSLGDLIETQLSRRTIIKAGLGAAVTSAFGLGLSGCASSGGDGGAAGDAAPFQVSFKSVSPSLLNDEVIVPQGYSARLFYAWGDPVSDGPAFAQDASNSAADQARQAGMHHDGMHFFALDGSEDEGLLVMNHEYVDPQLLHPDGGFADSPATWSAEKIQKEINAHGVSVLHLKKNASRGEWEIVRPSALARRITADTPMNISGPAAGSSYLRTAADPAGSNVLGTLNNCANGYTPWGSYLTCEENFRGYFAVPDASGFSAEQQTAWNRYGIGRASWYGWENGNDRFNAQLNPNEPNRFGWIVEIDPRDPGSTPVKRTALGRFAHENVAWSQAGDGRMAFYSGDDARFEYLYKFVTTNAYGAANPASGADLLDDGVLYVARFNADGSGQWLSLQLGHNGLDSAAGFADQADVLVRTRMAADHVGATPMDRPEWVAVQPDSNAVFVTLTNNSRRGGANQPAADAANPRAQNVFGHIVKIEEDGGDATATTFRWSIFALCGDPALQEPDRQGDVVGDLYANPDGLWFDPRGVMWIQTDIGGSAQNVGDFAVFGNNQMLAVNPQTGETRRFLTGPVGCEVTGVAMSPDYRTMWVNIQHPGDVPGLLSAFGVEKTPDNPTVASSWPDGEGVAGRPRSATVLITRDDGGEIGI